MWHPATVKGNEEDKRGERLGSSEWRDYHRQFWIDECVCVCVSWQSNLGLNMTAQTRTILTPAQFPPYINMGADSCAFPKKKKS